MVLTSVPRIKSIKTNYLSSSLSCVTCCEENTCAKFKVKALGKVSNGGEWEDTCHGHWEGGNTRPESGESGNQGHQGRAMRKVLLKGEMVFCQQRQLARSIVFRGR